MHTNIITNLYEAPGIYAFIKKCNDLNYKNNNSLKSMKFQWCLNTGGAWHTTVDNDGNIISLSGIHPFKDGYRALFRGVQLYPRNVGLSKYHMQSHCFYYQLPYQIKFANESPVYITTNTINDASGKMTRIDNTFRHLQRVGLVDYISSEEVSGALQNVWKLNVEKYNAVRY